MHLTHLVKNRRKTRRVPLSFRSGAEGRRKDGGPYCHLTETRFNDGTRGIKHMWVDFLDKKLAVRKQPIR